MLALSSQPIASALVLFSHRSAANVQLPSSNGPTDLKIRGEFATLFTDLLANLGKGPEGENGRNETENGSLVEVESRQTREGEITSRGDEETGRISDVETRRIDEGAIGNEVQQHDGTSSNPSPVPTSAPPNLASPSPVLPAPSPTPISASPTLPISISPTQPVSPSPTPISASASLTLSISAAPILPVAPSLVLPVSASPTLLISLSPILPLPLSLSPILPLAPSPVLPLEMDLHSAELGPMQLRISMVDSRVSVHLWVRDDEAKRRLEEHLVLLRARLADLGVELANFDVDRDDSQHSAQTEPELSANLLQSASDGLPNLRKTLAPVTNSLTLVDIIA